MATGSACCRLDRRGRENFVLFLHWFFQEGKPWHSEFFSRVAWLGWLSNSYHSSSLTRVWRRKWQWWQTATITMSTPTSTTAHQQQHHGWHARDVPCDGGGGRDVVGGGGSTTATVIYRSNMGHRLAVQRLGCMDLSGWFHVWEVSIDENSFHCNYNINCHD